MLLLCRLAAEPFGESVTARPPAGRWARVRSPARLFGLLGLDLVEEVNTTYVGMTRAKHSLYVPEALRMECLKHEPKLPHRDYWSQTGDQTCDQSDEVLGVEALYAYNFPHETSYNGGLVPRDGQGLAETLRRLGTAGASRVTVVACDEPYP